MKNMLRETLEAYRPTETPMRCVTFCLEQLFKDTRHSTSDYVAGCCTYEELIGALLHARDVIDEAATIHEEL